MAELLRRSQALLKATLEGDSETVGKILDAVHMENTSVLAYHNENALSCVVTLAYFSARKDYFLIREMPAGKGFADIVFLPRKQTDLPAFVVELKWNQSAQGAVWQIKQKQYVQSFIKYTGEILLVGINYDKKNKQHQCVIENVEKA